MADKMKKQQEEARAEAMKPVEKKKEAVASDTKTGADGNGKRETRTSARQQQQPPPTASADDARPAPKQKKGKPKKAQADGNISSYFQKADVEVAEDNPTVQEAAADEYEANPTALGEQYVAATQQPELVTGGKMRRYQLEGLEWLKSLWMNGLCGILADEMGLGKTVQAISLIAFFKEKGVSGPFLVAAPLSTVSNWVDEFARWTPGIKTVLYHGSKDERAAMRRNLMKLQNQRSMDFPVVCTSYEICMNDRRFLAQYQWRYIVVVGGVHAGWTRFLLTCRRTRDIA
jgi:ATP-dependent DNA helicase